MESKNVTIKDNIALLELTGRCKDSKENVIDFLLNKLFEYELIGDEKDYCGKSLVEILNEDGKTLTGFTLKIFGVCTSSLLYIMKDIYIWGKEYDCPDCGCELNYDNDPEGNYCNNCDYDDRHYIDYESAFGGRDYDCSLRMN